MLTASRTSGRPSRTRRRSATTRSSPPTRTRSTGSAVVHRSAGAHEVPAADEPGSPRRGEEDAAEIHDRRARDRRGDRRPGRLRVHDVLRRPLLGAGVPRTDGPPDDGRRRLLRVLRAPTLATDADRSGRTWRVDGGMERHRRLLDRRDRRSPANLLDPDVDFVTLLTQSKLGGERPVPDDDPRHLRHADDRQPGHAEEPARLVILPPRHEPRGPSADRRDPR